MTRQKLFKLADEYKETQDRKSLFNLENDEAAVLTEESLKQFHQILGGTGKYRTDKMQTTPIGTVLAPVEELSHLIGHFISQLQISRQMFHPIEYATICHKRILELYPFEDKNEEVAFLVLNLLLTQSGYKAIVIGETEKEEYRKLLRAAQHPSHPSIDEFITFIAECEVKALKTLE